MLTIINVLLMYYNFLLIYFDKYILLKPDFSYIKIANYK